MPIKRKKKKKKTKKDGAGGQCPKEQDAVMGDDGGRLVYCGQVVADECNTA